MFGSCIDARGKSQLGKLHGHSIVFKKKYLWDWFSYLRALVSCGFVSDIYAIFYNRHLFFLFIHTINTGTSTHIWSKFDV